MKKIYLPIMLKNCCRHMYLFKLITWHLLYLRKHVSQMISKRNHHKERSQREYWEDYKIHKYRLFPHNLLCNKHFYVYVNLGYKCIKCEIHVDW